MFIKKSTKNQGFTIIEVLIVLAIAGLIMLIVFLAVPALQRNSRNTQRRDEVGTLAGSISEYVSNNNGKLPGVWDTADAEFQTLAADANGTGTEPKLSFYLATNIALATSVPAVLPTADADKVFVYTSGKCAGTNGTTPMAGTSRQVAIYFFVESSAGGSATAQCIEG